MPHDLEDFGTRGRSFEQCEHAAQLIRQAVGCSGDEPVPNVSSSLAALSLEIVIRSQVAMGDALAYARPDEKEIHIREDLIPEILDDTPKARFVSFHEVVHACFHRGQSRFFRMASGNVILAFLPEDERVENQADWIADAALMPLGMVESCGSAIKLAQFARAPLDRAIERFRTVTMQKARCVPSDIRSAIARLRTSGTAGHRRNLQMDELKTSLWHELPSIPGEDSALNRKCDGYWIKWVEFGRTTQCGWYIDNNTIRSYFASQNK